MVTLKVNDKVIKTPKVRLKGKGNIQITSNNSDVIISNIQPDYDDWYTTTLAKKSQAMLTGGSSKINDYDFKRGIKSMSTPVTRIQGIAPDESGDLTVVGGKNADVSVDPENSTIIISPVKLDCKYADNLKEIDAFIFRLYHAINGIAARLHIFNPTNHDHGFGPQLGTVKAYQALLARWNHYVWLSSLIFRAEEVGEKGAIVLGYTNSICSNYDVFISCIIHHEEPFMKHSNSLTLFLQGDESYLEHVDRYPEYAAVKVLTETFDGAELIPVASNGYPPILDRPMPQWSDIIITIKIPAGCMSVNGFYKKGFSIAPAVHANRALYPIANSDEKTKLTITAIWDIDNGKTTFTKTARLTLDKISDIPESDNPEDVEPSDNQNNPPTTEKPKA